MCREIGNDASVMYADYSISCDSSDYTMTLMLCLAMTLLWPIGVPAFLFYQMYKVRTEIKEGAIETRQKFAPLLGDYDQDHWYWEVRMFWKLLCCIILPQMLRVVLPSAIEHECISIVVFPLTRWWSWHES